MRRLLLLLCISALLPPVAAAQTQLASWTVAGDAVWAVGQAQGGAALATWLGGSQTWVGCFSVGPCSGGATFPGFGSVMAVQNTDMRTVVADKFGGSVSMYSAAGLVARYVYPSNPGFARWPADLVPIEDGKVLVAVSDQNPRSSFQVFDRNLALVDSFPVRPDAAVISATRRPDGSIVVCTGVDGNFSSTRLMALTSTGTVLWDVFIGGTGGPVASDARGAVYVLQNGGTPFVYSPDGVFDHVWTGASFHDIASSLDGTVLYGTTGSLTVVAYGNLPTPVHSMSWGHVKQLYR